MRRLFLDDIRNPIDCVLYRNNKIYLENWDIVRNYDEFVKYILDNGIPDVVSFDHDLADEHYSPTMNDSVRYNELSNQFKEKTGNDCAKWLCEYCVKNGLPLPEYYTHSMNPVGRENIMSTLKSCEKVLGF
jgi:hypothetical protein